MKAWPSAVCLVVGLAGCVAVGPDFVRPKVPELTGAPEDRYGRAALQATVQADAPGGIAQTLQFGRKVDARWWEAFGSPGVNALVQQALDHNPSIEAMSAALRQAREAVRAQEGQYYPVLQAGYSATRQKNPTGTLSPTLSSGDPLYNLHTAQLTVGFVPDVFGANRRQVESLQAQAESQEYQMVALQLTLASNVVATAVQIAALDDQLTATRDIVSSAQKVRDMLQHQFAAGAVSGLDVAAQDTALAQAQALLPPLQKQREQALDALAILLGESPAQLAEQSFTLQQLSLPASLPLSLPATLVDQRPDVRAAEAMVHSASAAVGVALANRLPQFALTANAGGTATEFGRMFASGNTFWAIAGSVSGTLYDFGTLQARSRGAQAALDQSVAQYRSVVLTAFQNVADVLVALDQDARSYAAAADAERAADRSYQLTRRQVEEGFVNVQPLLVAEQAYLQTRLNRIQAYSARLGDSAALYQALGGGWNSASGETASKR